MLEGYRQADLRIVDAEAEPRLAAEHSVFNVPVLLLMAEGKEYRRYHGAFSMNTVQADLDRLIALMES